MKLTDAENRFFDLIEVGYSVSRNTEDIAKCSRVFATVIKKIGLADKDGIYTGAFPINTNTRAMIKQAVTEYRKLNGNSCKTETLTTMSDANLEKDTIETIKAAKKRLEALGYTVHIELSKKIEI